MTVFRWILAAKLRQWGRTTPLFSWRLPSSVEENPPVPRSKGRTKQREEASSLSGGRALAVVLPQLVGVCLPLHTKQQVSGTESGEEQVIGWHVFRAQKMFPFWEERGSQNSSSFAFESTALLNWPCSSHWDSEIYGGITEITSKWHNQLDQPLQQKHHDSKLLFSSDSFCKLWTAFFLMLLLQMTDNQTNLQIAILTVLAFLIKQNYSLHEPPKKSRPIWTIRLS